MSRIANYIESIRLVILFCLLKGSEISSAAIHGRPRVNPPSYTKAISRTQSRNLATSAEPSTSKPLTSNLQRTYSEEYLEYRKADMSGQSGQTAKVLAHIEPSVSGLDFCNKLLPYYFTYYVLYIRLYYVLYYTYIMLFHIWYSMLYYFIYLINCNLSMIANCEKYVYKTLRRKCIKLLHRIRYSRN